MPGIKELKTRIRSIGSTRKITRAMQLVSAAKMRKAQQATLNSRTYSSLAWELIENLSSSISTSSEYEREKSIKSQGNRPLTPFEMENKSNLPDSLLQSFPTAPKMAVLALSTNRGLVGSLNVNLLNTVQHVIASEAKQSSQDGKKIASDALAMTHGVAPITSADLIIYGRKAKEYSVRSGKNVIANFEKHDRTISAEEVFPVAKLISDLYSGGQYRKVLIIYNHFVSTLLQKPVVKQLLPFGEPRQQGTGMRVQSEKLNPEPSPLTPSYSDYLFEPTPSLVFEHLLPRIIESQIYQAILENEASEQSARMIMMKNATDAAGDLIDDLTLTYNKLRQNKITTELAEITAGKIALE